MAADEDEPLQRASDAAACVACAIGELQHATATLTGALRELTGALTRLQSEREAAA